MSQQASWRLVTVLSIIAAGAALGNERAQYFWDLTIYVASLDSPFPYRFNEPYPFLYPPLAADLFRATRSHLFELFSIAYVGAIAWFVTAFGSLNAPRRFEWLAAITAMGGLGVVSLLSGNVGVLMNLGLLALLIQAAEDRAWARTMLPVAIGFGSLIKPQFALYLGLLPLIDHAWRSAIVKMAVVMVVVAMVYGSYMVLRPYDWNEYVQAVIVRTTVVKDFGWGPAAYVMRSWNTTAAALAADAAALALVSALAFATWKTSMRSGQQVPRVVVACLGFVVLTFANPRMPLYDMYAAGLALAVCGAYARRTTVLPLILAVMLAINLVPWTIANFARSPAAYPGWLSDLLFAHMLGLVSVLIALSRIGVQAEQE